MLILVIILIGQMVFVVFFYVVVIECCFFLVRMTSMVDCYWEHVPVVHSTPKTRRDRAIWKFNIDFLEQNQWEILTKTLLKLSRIKKI